MVAHSSAPACPQPAKQSSRAGRSSHPEVAPTRTAVTRQAAPGLRARHAVGRKRGSKRRRRGRQRALRGGALLGRGAGQRDEGMHQRLCADHRQQRLAGRLVKPGAALVQHSSASSSWTCGRWAHQGTRALLKGGRRRSDGACSCRSGAPGARRCSPACHSLTHLANPHQEAREPAVVGIVALEQKGAQGHHQRPGARRHLERPAHPCGATVQGGGGAGGGRPAAAASTLIRSPVDSCCCPPLCAPAQGGGWRAASKELALEHRGQLRRTQDSRAVQPIGRRQRRSIQQQ